MPTSGSPILYVFINISLREPTDVTEGRKNVIRSKELYGF